MPTCESSPGSIEVRRLEPDAPRADADARAEPGASSHHVGGGELVALAAELTGHRPEAVEIGIGIADIELGEGLTPAVEGALPKVAEIVVEIGRGASRPVGTPGATSVTVEGRAAVAAMNPCPCEFRVYPGT